MTLTKWHGIQQFHGSFIRFSSRESTYLTKCFINSPYYDKYLKRFYLKDDHVKLNIIVDGNYDINFENMRMIVKWMWGILILSKTVLCTYAVVSLLLFRCIFTLLHTLRRFEEFAWCVNEFEDPASHCPIWFAIESGVFQGREISYGTTRV